MGIYSSWISVNDFVLTVDADNKEEAREKMLEKLGEIHVYVTEGGCDSEELSCMITDIDEGVC